MDKEVRSIIRWIVGIVATILLLVCVCCYAVPKYGVWAAELNGRAELVRAEQNRKIRIFEAEANLEAEKLNAEAEVARAQGAARAIEIENGKLTETYIRYLWVRQQSDLGEKTVVYIPTEGGLPILEAGRLGKAAESSTGTDKLSAAAKGAE